MRQLLNAPFASVYHDVMFKTWLILMLMLMMMRIISYYHLHVVFMPVRVMFIKILILVMIHTLMMLMLMISHAVSQSIVKRWEAGDLSLKFLNWEKCFKRIQDDVYDELIQHEMEMNLMLNEPEIDGSSSLKLYPPHHMRRGDEPHLHHSWFHATTNRKECSRCGNTFL